jgi:Acylamino-acid-releasing enzyme, N-terminal domain
MNDSTLCHISSPSGQQIAIIRNEPNHDPTKKVYAQCIEIWHQSSLMHRIKLQPFSENKHGSVIIDPNGHFGIPSWNYQENMIVYTAERLLPESKSFFDDISTTKGGDGIITKNANTIIGKQNTLGYGKIDTFGEKYYKIHPIYDIYVLYIPTGRIERVDNVPGGKCLSKNRQNDATDRKTDYSHFDDSYDTP